MTAARASTAAGKSAARKSAAEPSARAAVPVPAGSDLDAAYPGAAKPSPGALPEQAAPSVRPVAAEAPRTAGAAVLETRRPPRKSAPPRPDAAPPPPRASAAEATVAAGTGFLVLKTNPPFAKVSLDGKELGVTPFASPLALPAGAHELRIEREGCLPATAPVLIEPGRTANLRVALDKAEAAAR